jgi:hypothetical protein
MTQGIRRKEDHWGNIRISMCHVWRCCYRLSDWAGKDLNELVREKANEVMQRDWIKHPDSAHLET